MAFQKELLSEPQTVHKKGLFVTSQAVRQQEHCTWELAAPVCIARAAESQQGCSTGPELCHTAGTEEEPGGAGLMQLLSVSLH